MNRSTRYLVLAMLTAVPLWAAGKTEITWMQYLHGIHYFKHYRSPYGYDGGDNDMICRQGGLFHPIKNYQDIPPPSRVGQDWTWRSPSGVKSWGTDQISTFPSHHRYHYLYGESESTPSGRTRWQAGYNKALQETFASQTLHSDEGPPSAGCVEIAVSGGVVVRQSPEYGPTPGWKFYRLGPCQGAGHRGTAYEANGGGEKYIYCVSPHYMLYSLNLNDAKYWQKALPALQKIDPAVARLANRIAAHPSKTSMPWEEAVDGPYGSFAALVQIGAVKLQIPPSWWQPGKGNCGPLPRGRSGGITTVCIY